MAEPVPSPAPSPAPDRGARLRAGVAGMRAWQDDPGLMPPAARGLGVRVTAVGAGTVELSMPLRPDLLLPGGRPSCSAPALMIDFGLAAAVLTLEPSTATTTTVVTTLSTTIEHVAPCPPAGELTARFRACLDDVPAHDAVEVRDGAARAGAGEVRDGTGALVAVTSGWLLTSVAPLDPGPPPAGPVTEPEGTGTATDVVARLGLEPVTDPARDDAWSLHVRPDQVNPVGTLHGGIGAMACEVAAELALGPGWRVVTCALTYLRPAPVGSGLRLGARVLRRGRRTAVVDVELTAADGRAALLGRCVGHRTDAPPPLAPSGQG